MNHIIQTIFCLLVLISSGCARTPQVPESIASIGPSKKWKIEENCGYEGCYPLVDFLKGEGISIRFDLTNTKIHRYQSTFSIQLTFLIPIEKNCTYNPPNTQLIYGGRNQIFPFRFGSYGEFRYESNDKLIDPIELTGVDVPGQRIKYHSFTLYFPVQNLPPSESFSLKINDFGCEGQKINIPIVNFQDGLRN